jgi:dihydroxyacetone kinase-like protein
MNGTQLAEVLSHVARTIESAKDTLCELDSHVGDGDHGVSMTIGMRAARQALARLADPGPSQALQAMSDAFADEVGASSGVLYEMAFAAAARAVAGQASLDRAEQWSTVFQAASGAIRATGGASVGDKTMLDAWQPASEAVRAAAAAGKGPEEALAAAASAAWAGVAATRDLIPKRGRASLLGERARGHQDAGATSAWLIIRALHEGVSRGRLAARLEPLQPSVLVWQAYAPFLSSGGSMSKAVEDAVLAGLFKSLELPVVADAAERRAIARMAADAGCEVLVWASDVQATEGLSLGSTDRDTRQRSKSRFRELVAVAASCGARRMGFCSPPGCAAADRADAIRHLGDGLAELSRAASDEGVSIVFEALDRAAHKKGLLGSSAELAGLSRRVAAEAPGFGVCWDTAHAALNGEDLAEGFGLVAPHVVIAHFSEAVLDPGDPRYGDWHMPAGKGDVLKPAAVASLAAMLRQHCRRSGIRLPLAIEEFNREPGISGGDSLRRAWGYLESCL